MLKFMKPQSKGITPERLQKQKELFAYSESCFHGFPSKPSALAWDPVLSLLAIGTGSGVLRIYGAPGVEFYCQHESESPVIRICFLPGQGALVTLCDNNSICLWKIQHDDSKDILIKVKSLALEGKLKKLSVIIPDADCKSLFLGTEGGNIYVVDLSNFSVTNDIIYQDVVMQNVPEDYKVNPGAVESIAPHPTEAHKLLVGYQRGLIVLWDRKQPCAEQTYVSNQQLESLSWSTDATEFVSSHNDGSYVVWGTGESAEPTDGPTTVYGPFPCKPMSKINWLCPKEESYIIFSGGMPRANYGDRHTVTVKHGEKHVTFNVSSKIVDFVVAEHHDSEDDLGLIILAEEEIVFIDLSSEEWLPYHNQYLSSLHSSAITCCQFVANVDSKLFEKIKEAGKNQLKNITTKAWPVSGGVANNSTGETKDLLLTGHEDGTVRFWDSTGLCLPMLYKMSTSEIFLSDDLGGDPPQEDDEDWPPFRKVGVFDPYSDDPRLGIKKLAMCPHTGQLIVAGTAGQIIISEVVCEKKEFVPECVDVNLVAETEGFAWKSHTKLDLQKNPITFESGFQPTVIVQFYPPASCTSLNMHSEWGLIAVGTAHGFSLFDYFTKRNLLAKSTLSANDLANACDEGPMSRRKSLKKSLRESFRRLRKGRSQRKPRVKETASAAPTKSPPDEEGVAKPVERAIEARSQHADYIGSMVRCLHLTKCYIASNQLMSATLWAGTNAGAVYVYTIFIPPSDKRMEVPLTVQLGKEIHLKHAAPVINIMILDGASRPFPEPMAVKKGAAPSPDNNGPHRVLISSEEQFKVFTLPQLKPFCKYKLTAHEGSRVRKMGNSTFGSVVDKEYKESCFTVVTNLGDISVFSLPGARRQVQAQCIKKEDINGINSVVFTKNGEVLYLSSASELSRISLSASHITSPKGTIFPLTESSKKVCSVVALKKDTNSPSATSLCSLKRLEDSKESADVSLLSADITIDSIRDHIPAVEDFRVVIPAASETITTTESTVKEESHTTKSVTIVKTSTIVSAEEGCCSSVQVIETAESPEQPAVAQQGSPSLEQVVHEQQNSE